MSPNQRTVLAIAISLLVLIGFQMMFPPEVQKAKQPQTVEQKDAQNGVETPVTQTTQKSAQPTPKNTTQTPSAQEDVQNLVRVEAEHFNLEIDSLGRVSQFYLKDTQFVEDDKYLKLFNDELSPKPFELRFSDKSLNKEAFKTAYSADKSYVKVESEPVTLTLTQTLSEQVVTKKITIHPNGTFNIDVALKYDSRYFISTGFRPDVVADGFTVQGVLVKEATDTLQIIEDGDAQGNEAFRDVRIVSAFDRYYASALYRLDGTGLNVVLSKNSEDEPIAFVEGEKEFALSAYIGPKDYAHLKSIDPALTSIIEYGFFTFISEPTFKVLYMINNVVGNWGWSIIILTILIRIILFPLTFKGMVSMQKLKDLAPKIKDLRAKYKDDPQKMNAHMMELYKKHGANPMGGCLPLLLQMPVFFAIYRVLLNAIELKGSEWILWIEDLSVMDPYYVLPILMGVTMYFHQKVTPTNFTDPMQEKIMKYLPLVFTFFFVTFPAGLTLYWFINNILSISQQLLVNRIFEAKKAKGHD